MGVCAVCDDKVDHVVDGGFITRKEITISIELKDYIWCCSTILNKLISLYDTCVVSINPKL